MAIGETTEERRERLDSYEHKSLKLLTENEIKFEQLGSYHFYVERSYDYWPRTGLFIHRKSTKRGRGVFNLIKKIKNQKSKSGTSTRCWGS